MEEPASSFRKRVTICNVKGLHARASAKFATKALEFRAAVTVTKEGTTVNAVRGHVFHLPSTMPVDHGCACGTASRGPRIAP